MLVVPYLTKRRTNVTAKRISFDHDSLIIRPENDKKEIIFVDNVKTAEAVVEFKGIHIKPAIK